MTDAGGRGGALVLAAFPETEIVEVFDRQAEAERWVDTIWVDDGGFACLGYGTGDRDFHQEFFRWPDGRGQFLHRALDLEGNVWVAPLLRREPKRKKETALPGRFLWADLDRPQLPAEKACLAGLVADGGALVVSSGRGRHVYVPLPGAEPPERLEVLNRRLAASIGGDAKWDATALLRLPGTHNVKYSPPRFVRWESP